MRRMVLIVLGAVLLLCFSGCKTYAPKDDVIQENIIPEDAWRDSDVNSFVNHTNNRKAAQQGATHYYYADDLLFREDLTGEHEIETIEVYGCKNINPVGDYVYYINENENSSGAANGGHIERYNVLTKEKMRYEGELGKYEDYLNLCVKDGYMYYMIYSYGNEQICRADIESGEVEVLLRDDSVTYYYINDNKIYYHFYAIKEGNKRVSQIYSMNLDGSDKKMLCETKELQYTSSFLPSTENGKTVIYLQNTQTVDEKAYLSVYDVASKTLSVIYVDEMETSETGGAVNIPDRIISGVKYFEYGSGVGILENTGDRIKTSKFISVAEKETWDIVGDYLYFTTQKNVSGHFIDVLHRILPNGKTEKISN